MILVNYYSIMTRHTWFSNDTDVATEYIYQNGTSIPSDSTEHYVPASAQLGHNWPMLKRGQKPPSGWQVVSHKRPSLVLTEDQERRRNKRKAEAEADFSEIMENPERRYKYERNQQILSQVQRLESQQDPHFSGWSRKKLWRHVDNYIGRADEPMILRNPNLAKSVEPSTASDNKQRAGSRRAAAIERRAEEGNLEYKEFSREFIEQIKATRARRTIRTEDGTRPMTQEDLGKMLNENANVIRDFEAGKLVFDGAFKAKLIWKLGLSV
jgi:hypothetical protein